MTGIVHMMKTSKLFYNDNNEPPTCPLCMLDTLILADDNNYICMNCGWSSINGNQLPSDPTMMGDNTI